jgi:hypothetical protein
MKEWISETTERVETKREEVRPDRHFTADTILSPQVLAQNFPPHCRRIAAQRAAGEASLATENEQLMPSALRPAAKAALVAARQNTSKAAATISISSLMAWTSQIFASTHPGA